MNYNVEKLKYIAAVFIYGTIGLFLRHISFPSEIVVLCRGIIGSLFILTYLHIKGQKVDLNAVKKNLAYLIASGICLGLNWIFLFAAYLHTTVAIASLCNYMAPIILILIAPIVLHEKISWKKFLCVIAALLGIVMVSGVLSSNMDVNVTGIMLGFAAAMGFVGIVICNKKISNISAYDKSIVQLSVSALTVLPYVIYSNYGSVIAVDTKSIILTLVLGIVHTGIAYCLYFGSMGNLKVQTVAILGYIEPVVSVICSAFFLHESMSFIAWIGAAMIIGAAAVSEIIPVKD